MAEPVSWAAMGLSALGGVIGAVGAEKSAGAHAQQSQYQASIAALNAQIALQNEEYASQKGEQDAQKYGMKAGETMGKIKAAQSSSGLDVNSGSAKDVRAGQQLVTNMDLTQIRSNAAKVAYDYRNESINQSNRAIMFMKGAQDEREAGDIAATSSIIGGATSVASMWMQGRKAGLYGGGGSSGGESE